MDVTKPPPVDLPLGRPDAGAAPTLTSRSAPTGPAVSAETSVATAVAALADAVHIHPLDLSGALLIMIAEVREELPLPAITAPPVALAPGVPPLPPGALPLAPGALPLAPGALPLAPGALPLPPSVPPLAPPGVLSFPPPGVLQLPSGEVPLRPSNESGAARLEPLLLAGGGLPAEPLAATAPQTLVQLFLQSLPPPEAQEPAAWLASVVQAEGAMQLALDRAIKAASVWRDVPVAVVDGVRETRDVVLAAITDDPPNPLWLRPEWLGLAPRMQEYRRRRRRARRWLSDPDLHWREPEDAPDGRPPSDQP